MATLEERLQRAQAAALAGRLQAAQATVAPEQAQAASQSPMGALNEGLMAELMAARQGASPVTRTLTGEANYPVVGELMMQESDIGPAGTMIQIGRDAFAQFDPETMVVFPEGGRMMVYERTPEMEEGALTRLGRLIGIGALAPTTMGETTQRAARPSQMQRSVEAMDQAGVTPTVPLATEGETARRVAQITRSIPFGGAPIDRGLARTREEIEGAAANVARQFGTAEQATEGGEVARLAGQDWLKRWRETGRTLDRKLRSNFGDTKIELTQFRQALDEPFEEFDNPALAELFPQEWLNKWRETVQASDGTVSYNDLLTLKQRIGKEISKPVILADKDRGQLERLYGALSDDLQTAADSISPEVGKAVSERNAYWSQGYDRIKQSLREVLDPQGTPERVFETLLQISREKGKTANIRKLRDIRDTVGPEAWGDVASSVLVRMGRAPGSAEVDTAFSPQSFFTNWNNLSDRAKEVLFSGNSAGRRNLDNLTRNVLPQLRRLERLENVSQTGQAVMGGGLGAGAVTGLAMGEPLAVLGTVGTMVGANALSRALMNPRFTRAIARGATASQNASWNAPRWWARNLPRLRALVETNPDLDPVVSAIEQTAPQQ